MGKAYVHTVIDDHSRVAYAEIHDDEAASQPPPSSSGPSSGSQPSRVAVERVLSDNGGAYRSHLWRDTCHELGVKHKRTRPHRPQTSGKIERSHRTLADGWVYARTRYDVDLTPRQALERQAAGQAFDLPQHQQTTPAADSLSM